MKIPQDNYIFLACAVILIGLWLYVSILNIANYHKYKIDTAQDKEILPKASGIKRFCLYLYYKLKQLINAKSRRNKSKS